MGGRDLGPVGPVELPRVIQVDAAWILAAEEDNSLSHGIECEAVPSASGGRMSGGHLGPIVSVVPPGVVEQTTARRSTEKHRDMACRVVRHRGPQTRWWYVRSQSLVPRRAVPLPRVGTDAVVVAAEQDRDSTRGVVNHRGKRAAQWSTHWHLGPGRPVVLPGVGEGVTRSAPAEQHGFPVDGVVFNRGPHTW